MGMREYFRLRSLGLSRSLAFRLSDMESVVSKVMSVMFMAGVLLALYFWHNLMLEREMREASVQVERHREEESKAINALATCFNGGVVKVGDIAVFCDRAVEQMGL